MSDERIIIRDLAEEIAQALAAANKDQWKTQDKENTSGVRRSLVAAINQHGWDADGVPGILPHILSMLEDGIITARSTFNDLPPVNVSDVSVNYANWYLSPQDAHRVKSRVLRYPSTKNETDGHPDWKLWATKQSVSLMDAVTLSLNICPDWLKDIHDRRQTPPDFKNVNNKLNDRLQAAESRAGEFDTAAPQYMEHTRRHAIISLSAFAFWAVNVAHWEVPEPLAKMAPPLMPDLSGNMKRWNLNVLTRDKAQEWARKPCWSMSEALFLLNGLAIEGDNTCQFPPTANAGTDTDWFRRAVLAKSLVPINHDEKGEAVYSPKDVIRTAENGRIGHWEAWKNLLEPTEGAEATAVNEQTARPQLRHPYQEQEILRVIGELGYDPQALPKYKPGKPGIKAEVRKKLTEPMWQGTVFDKAWERISKGKQIRYAD